MSDRAKFALLTAARWAPIGLMTPISVLYMQSRGLSLSTIGVVAIVYTLTVAALEIPTGSFADAFGHRRMLVIGTGVSIAKFSLMFLAHSAAAVHRCLRAARHGTRAAQRSVGGVVRGAAAPRRTAGPVGGRDCGVGRARRPAHSSRAFSHSCSADRLRCASRSQLPSCSKSCTSARCSCLLPRATGSGAAPAHIAFTTVAHAGRDPHLRRLLLAPLTLGFALYSVELLWQPRLATFVGADDTFVFGVFATVAFASSALGAWLVVRAIAAS